MLRISLTTETAGTTITLEGRVVGAWVDELSACWRRLLASAAHPIRVDLDGVTFIDDSGKALLRVMQADGAVLTARAVMMRAVVEEIASGARDHRRPEPDSVAASADDTASERST